MAEEILGRRPQQTWNSKTFIPTIDERALMMAFEKRPDAPGLEPKTIDALRAAFARSVSTGNHQDTLRDLLCETAAEAREKGMRAEQLLIALKDIWFSLPELTRKTPTDVDNGLLQDLISRCIREYYAV